MPANQAPELRTVRGGPAQIRPEPLIACPACGSTDISSFCRAEDWAPGTGSGIVQSEGLPGVELRIGSDYGKPAKTQAC